jgi:hypothetical protein
MTELDINGRIYTVSEPCRITASDEGRSLKLSVVTNADEFVGSCSCNRDTGYIKLSSFSDDDMARAKLLGHVGDMARAKLLGHVGALQADGKLPYYPYAFDGNSLFDVPVVSDKPRTTFRVAWSRPMVVYNMSVVEKTAAAIRLTNVDYKRPVKEIVKDVRAKLNA